VGCESLTGLAGLNAEQVLINHVADTLADRWHESVVVHETGCFKFSVVDFSARASKVSSVWCAGVRGAQGAVHLLLHIQGPARRHFSRNDVRLAALSAGVTDA